MVEEYAAETTEAIENLANAAIQNQAMVQVLTETNRTITHNLIEANQKLTEALATITALHANGAGFQFGGRGAGRGRGADCWVGGRCGRGRGAGRGAIAGGREMNSPVVQ